MTQTYARKLKEAGVEDGRSPLARVAANKTLERHLQKGLKLICRVPNIRDSLAVIIDPPWAIVDD